MLKWIKQLAQDKREYRAQLARVKAMPAEYRFVFDKIQQYMWGYAGGTGTDMLNTIGAIVELFEAGAAEGRPVLDITGEDITGFCDGLMQDTRKWTDYYREKLNRELSQKLQKGKKDT